MGNSQSEYPGQGSQASASRQSNTALPLSRETRTAPPNSGGRRPVSNRGRNAEPDMVIPPVPNNRRHQRPQVGGRGPGAYSVQGPGARAGNSDTIPYSVTVPPNVRPGQEFQVYAGGTPMMVRCPAGSGPGSRIMVMAPRQPRHQQVYMVTVPAGVRPGERFAVLVNNERMNVTCPQNVRPGMQIRITLPDSHRNNKAAQKPQMNQTFEVTVPPGVKPGQPFALIANGQRVMVNCPMDANPGQKIRFQLPMQLSADQLQSFKLHYNKDGWIRCVGTDLKFHWVNTKATPGFNKRDSATENGDNVPYNVAEQMSSTLNLRRQVSTFDPSASAFVRKLDKQGNQYTLSLERAQDVVMETSVPETHVGFQDLTRVNAQSFEQKSEWFKNQCNILRVPWDIEHQHIKVRRNNLLEDSMTSLRSIPTDKCKQIFRFEFIGEPGIDAGGVAREWFHLVSEQLFNPDFALFQFGSVDQMCMQINPNSVLVEDQLDYFHFAGRLLGKALFDGQLVQSHLVRPIYKHLLGWPLLFNDLEQVDSETYNGILKMLELDDVSVCCIDFTVTEERLGTTEVIDLIEGGGDIIVDNGNLSEYLEKLMKYRLCDRIKDQLTAFLTGFYDVVPEPLLSVFDFQEIELLLCGLPTIDIEDWKRNTEYVGDYERKKHNHTVVQWFWSVVEHDFSAEQQARLLQFVTGTSGVPPQGFSVLQGNDGNIRKFTINSLSLDSAIFPRAHTCFNRIDLPLYKSKGDLRSNLSLAVQLEATGFDID
mmetsp:Transcript_14870/g.19615  ORF Transcript_14870/g.19615 Transcript_14870/m.19615 type:complete len:762 (+) Transcript_14870:270-2555(+)